MQLLPIGIAPNEDIPVPTSTQKVIKANHCAYIVNCPDLISSISPMK